MTGHWIPRPTHLPDVVRLKPLDADAEADDEVDIVCRVAVPFVVAWPDDRCEEEEMKEEDGDEDEESEDGLDVTEGVVVPLLDDDDS